MQPINYCLMIIFSLFISIGFPQGNYSLICKIDSSLNLEGETFYLKYIDYSKMNPVINDSARVEEGKFIFKGSLNTPGVYSRLISKSDKSEYWFMLSAGESKATLAKPKYNEITGEKRGFTSSFDIPGNDKFRLMQIFDKLYDLYGEESSKFHKLANEVEDETLQQNLSDSAFMYMEKRDPYVISLIKDNPDNYISLFILKYFTPVPLKKDINQLEDVFKLLNPRLRESKEGLELLNVILAKKKLKVGSEAPDFSMFNQDGQTVKLSDFKGKKVLLDFWATWCGPCIDNLPKLKDFARNNLDYHIVAISLDNNKSNWINGIKKLDFEWAIHLSDLQSWKSPINVLYNIEAIPRSILIDEMGIIRNLDFKLE